MDIDLLSKLVKELLAKRNSVSLPGVGTFVSEQAPATFSDNGYTINPPYRKVSFRQRESDDDSLALYYAEACSLDKKVAQAVLKEFLEGMTEVLIDKKVIIFPGLGLLRSTKENHFFFVPDAEGDINADGFALSPISLKSRELPADEKPSPVEVPREVKPVSKKKKHPFLVTIMVLLVVTVVLAALLRILGSKYPETLDKFLYSEEEYSLIHTR